MNKFLPFGHYGYNYKDKLELEKVQQQTARFVCNNYDPMYSVTVTINQLNWQKLENHRDNSCLCLLFKIMQHQTHVPTDDIPPSAPTTVMRSSHERNLLVPYVRTNRAVARFSQLYQ